ncbi:hypothetical protein [Pseudomonas sp. DWP3-1-2]|uniref:hypothetical protein n=1 Tax=Pseudomonas sp. DWP3-1-2 TaxID=2804645 RepID=UPI003CE929E1
MTNAQPIAFELKKCVLSGQNVMTWDIKAHPRPTLLVDIVMSVLILVPVGFILYGWPGGSGAKANGVFVGGGLVGVVFYLYLWIMAGRQKTLYSYCIGESGVCVEYRQYYPKYAKHFFKGLATLFFVCIFTMIAMDPDFIWMLAGPSGLALVAAKFLLIWENEVGHSSFQWDRPQLVFTDRTRGLVVLQRRYDPDIPFEENCLYFEAFLPKHRIDEFLAIARLYAPSGVDYQEGRCYE